MSHSSNPTASHKEAHLTLRELEPPLPELDDMNEDLLPIQLSAQNTPTAVRLWPQIEELIKPNLRGHYPDLLNITDVNPRLATQLHRRIEQVGPKAVRSSFDTTTGCFTIKMPTPVHNCVCQWSIDSIVEWRVTGLITAAEKNILNFTVADRLELPNGSNKEPDGLWVVDGLDYPTVCIEVGWSESQPLLERDMRKLLLGSQGHISVVFLIKWYQRKAKVAGNIQVWRLDAAGVPQKDREEILFPRATSTQAPITITRQELFGSQILQGRPPTDAFPFSLDDLRHHARVALAKVGLVPL